MPSVCVGGAVALRLAVLRVMQDGPMFGEANMDINLAMLEVLYHMSLHNASMGCLKTWFAQEHSMVCRPAPHTVVMSTPHPHRRRLARVACVRPQSMLRTVPRGKFDPGGGPAPNRASL